MSLLKSIGRALGSVARVAAPILSVVAPPLGVAAGAIGMLGSRSQGASSASPMALSGALSPLPGAGFSAASMVPAMGALPGAARAAGTLATGAYAVGRAAGRIYGSAARYCRTNPGWCQSIGGIAAVEGLIRSGQLPVHKGRRGRGITARELRSFRKVHGVLGKFCAPRMRIKRRKSCP
jgi:hypothetical protein